MGNADAHIKSAIQRAIAQLDAVAAQRRPPADSDSRTRAGPAAGQLRRRDRLRAGRCRWPAISRSPELSAVKTVAYIPRSIKGHGVLVALACEEIVMAPDAEIGEAGIDEDERRAVEPGIVSSYQQIAAARRTVPEAIALGMLDRRAEVLKVETDQGTEFVLRDDLAALKQNHTIVSEEVLVPRGSLGSFTGREGREFGFVKLLAPIPTRWPAGWRCRRKT